jgi:hypothetical protein
MLRRLPCLALLASISAMAVPSAASAAPINVFVGIGDQQPTMFDNPHYKALKLKKTRYFIRWNSIDSAHEIALADAFVAKARANRVKVLMHISTEDLGAKKGQLPTVRQYRQKVGALIKRYRPRGVTEWGTWNEANHKTQPTWNNPRRAAQYFLEMRKMCSRCTIVALDLLDQRGVERYLASWYRALGRRNVSRATIVGIHNYSDTNRLRSRGTASIIKAVKKRNARTQFWLTETGGVVRLGNSWPCNPDDPASVAAAEARQVRAINYMFKLVRQFRRDVKRLYSYNWTGTSCTNHMDVGLTKLDGSPRPSYTAFRKQLRNFRR